MYEHLKTIGKRGKIETVEKVASVGSLLRVDLKSPELAAGGGPSVAVGAAALELASRARAKSCGLRLVRESSNWKIGPRPSRFEFYVGSPRLSKWLEL